MSSLGPIVTMTSVPGRAGPKHAEAVQRIEDMLLTLGMDQKELCLGIGMAESVFSQKKRGIRSHFYEDEFHAIAEFFRRVTKRPLIGFPHLNTSQMLRCDRLVGHWRGP